MTNPGKIASLCGLGRWDVEDPIESSSFNGFSDVKRLIPKVSMLRDGTARDTCGWSESRQLSGIDIAKSLVRNGIYRASTPRGTCTLFKTLYTNSCGFDCAYCVNSVKNQKIYSYTPHEVANIFHVLLTKRMVDGLFLSSSMGRDPETTMDAMIRSVEIIRTKYAFRGYIHLKILPGVSRYQVERATQLANRVSLNIEEPNASRLGKVCSVKEYNVDILERQAWITDFSLNLPSGQATQFIVGASDESDLEIINRMHYLYHELQMRRIYYSAFKPVPHTKLQSRNATPSWRERRLYQTDWLHRVYHYPIKEICDALIDDFLPNVDPKITLARLYIDKPIEVNEATKIELLRIPGIGPRSAKRIIETRKKRERIRSKKQLVKMGVVINRAQPFLKINGSHQSTLKNWF